MAERVACISVSARRGAQIWSLAATMTRETGKPIRCRATNSTACWAHRLLPGAGGAVGGDRDRVRRCGMTEQIQHVPLGVVANISAWNYPWFVGCNVFVPALLTGNAVLYKPSEYAP
jgi:acyl-CoA reductase-like NAD-dependent aldehyde dehydrogenase